MIDLFAIYLTQWQVHWAALKQLKLIIGISIDEDRETVEYLKKHPHGFPVVLSSENSLPRPYQIGVLPTYLVIGADGTLISAEEGDQGFGRLRKTLEKAGMVTE